MHNENVIRAEDYDFAVGSMCVVNAAAEGFVSHTTETFEVTPGGTDLGDLFLDSIPS